MFQSYQSKQINPDSKKLQNQVLSAKGFQSYQSKQINPDKMMALTVPLSETCGFNRINPNRSIPIMDIPVGEFKQETFQSYQSKQINPDLYLDKPYLDYDSKFQSYQSKQIKPDPY